MMLDRVEAVPADASEHDEKRCHVSGKNWKELENDPDIVQNGSLWVQHIPPSLDIALTSYGVAQKSQRLRLTAYVGLEVVAKVQAGEKLVVSGAAGAVGSLVCQIGKEKGAKVYAIAGSAEKCAWLEQDVGVDKALNYKSPTFHDDFANAVGSFDLFFDNVGGELLDYRMNLHARVIICGYISDYNVAKPKGLTEYANILSSQATVQGFTVMSYLESFPAGRKYFAERLKSGTLKRKFHVIEGLEEAPKALAMLFSGQNNGKL
ncbi:hypothetical protein AcV7_007032 [Taiwanofungus camphoratus]|nr:hypothetical protein AcV7_007032 [Antrodia cinnamomea]